MAKLFTPEEVYDFLYEVMNMGMNLRQNQLSGERGLKSGKEILDEWWEKIKSAENGSNGAQISTISPNGVQDKGSTNKTA